MMTLNKRITIFSPGAERLFFFVLAVFLALSVISLLGVVPSFTLNDDRALFVVRFIFLNTVHTGFTYLFLGALPEARGWVKEWLKSSWNVPAFILFFFLILSIFACFKGSQSPLMEGRLFYLISTSLLLFASIHNISQTKGLSFLYNRKAKITFQLSEHEELKFQRAARDERILFGVVVILVAALIVNFNLKESYSSVLDHYLEYFSLCCVFLLIGNSFRYPRALSSNKSIYLCSLLFYPFMTQSKIALYSQLSIHGIEYAFCTREMFKRSSFKINTPSILFIGLFLGFYIFIMLPYAARFIVKMSDLTSSVQMAVLFVCTPCEYFHYYLDGKIFRFQNPLVQKYIAPIFVHEWVPER